MANRGTPRRRQQRARASGHARVNQVGGDQYIYGPGSGPTPQGLAGLPAAPADLVGRQDQVGELIGLLAPAIPASSRQNIATVVGLPGVGKTALALHVAHEAVARDWFPGGAVFIPFHSYDPVGQVNAEQALASVLRTLGIRDTDLPPTADEQAALYRSELARRAGRGERLLVVADDVAAVEQVRSLVPADPMHRLLVTSRHTLTSPTFATRLVSLDVLMPDPAAHLIANVVLCARPQDLRPSQEPEALTHIAAHCGCLPLALQIAGALLASDPGLPLATLQDDLADTRTRLEALRHDEGDGQSLAVRTAFDLSYRRQSPQQALIFRLLAINPGPEITTDAAAALIGKPVRETRQLLCALAQASLLSEQPVGADRWRMHDLIRLYITEVAEKSVGRSQHEKALVRLLDHYLVLTRAADSHLNSLPGELVSSDFGDHHAALAWLDLERPNLVSAAILAASTGHHHAALAITAHLSRFLLMRHFFEDAVNTGNKAVDSARRSGDRHNEGGALGNLASALQGAQRFDEAIDAHGQALSIFRRAGNRRGESEALNNLGVALGEEHRFGEALDAHRRALSICRELGDRRGEAGVLHNLGCDLGRTREFEEAVEVHKNALALYRDLGDRYGEATALNSLGVAAGQIGQFGGGVEDYRQAVALYRAVNDHHGEGVALNNLGRALLKDHLLTKAINAHEQALSVACENGDSHAEAIALSGLGVALKEGRQFGKAVDVHRRAVALFREIGDRDNERMALTNLGDALRKVRRVKEAVETYRQALVIARELGDRHREGIVLNHLGESLKKMRQFAKAIEAYEQSLIIARELGARNCHCESTALAGIEKLQNTGWPRRWWRTITSMR